MGKPGFSILESLQEPPAEFPEEVMREAGTQGLALAGAPSGTVVRTGSWAALSARPPPVPGITAAPSVRWDARPQPAQDPGMERSTQPR